MDNNVSFTNPSEFSPEYDGLPMANRERVAVATYDFIKGLMNNPETRALLEAKMAANRAASSRRSTALG